MVVTHARCKPVAAIMMITITTCRVGMVIPMGMHRPRAKAGRNARIAITEMMIVIIPARAAAADVTMTMVVAGMAIPKAMPALPVKAGRNARVVITEMMTVIIPVSAVTVAGMMTRIAAVKAAEEKAVAAMTMTITAMVAVINLY